MKRNTLKFYVIFNVFIWNFCFASESNPINSILDPLQIIRRFGYPAELHTVETADGYLLGMHRIPHGKDHSADSSSPRRAIFMNHCLIGSSIDFLVNGTEYALPFLLSDLGFDVWLGNSRGNKYSRGHVELSPNSKTFWNFTWHETGIYDNPAQIDYILSTTNQEKIIYIGYSSGTTTFFVTTSSRPEYNNKIDAAFLMGVSVYFKHFRSPFLRLYAPFSTLVTDLILSASNGEFSDKSPLVISAKKFLCNSKIEGEAELCLNIIFLVSKCNPAGYKKEILPRLINHYPKGCSIKSFTHYVQLIHSGKFRAYDYGKRGNIRQYGTPFPPDYNLKAVTVPMYFYEGKNDYISNLKDVTTLSTELPSLRMIRVVGNPQFCHFDFILSYDVKKFVFDPLIKDLMSYLNDNSDVNISQRRQEGRKKMIENDDEGFAYSESLVEKHRRT